MRITGFFVLLAVLMLCCSDIENKASSQTTDATSSAEAGAATTVANETLSETQSSPAYRLGKQVYFLCVACHNTTKEGIIKVGPSLHQIFGRKIATYEGFEFSDELKAKDWVWDETNMKEWIKDPNTYIPGNKMAFIGVPDEKKVEALIEYLKIETK